MFGFFKKMFIATIGFIGFNTNAVPLECVSMSDQECKVRPEIMNVNSNASLFYLYSVLINKCSGSCNDVNNPYAKLFVSDVV